MPNSFIAFSYGDWHSIYSNSGAEVYRTNNKIDINLIPTLNDTFKDDSAHDGQFWLGSTYKNRTFKIDITYYNLTQGQMNAIIETFNGKEIKELVFDELPFKAYDAKVTGTPTFKFIPFDSNGTTVYHGEGTINFTCYQPYAHTPKNGIWSPTNKVFYQCDPRNLTNYINAGYKVGEWRAVANLPISSPSVVGGRLPAPFIATGTTKGEITINGSNVKFTLPNESTHPFYHNGAWTLNSDNGSIVDDDNEGIYYTGITVGKLEVGSALSGIGYTIKNNKSDLPFWYY